MFLHAYILSVFLVSLLFYSFSFLLLCHPRYLGLLRQLVHHPRGLHFPEQAPDRRDGPEHVHAVEYLLDRYRDLGARDHVEDRQSAPLQVVRARTAHEFPDMFRAANFSVRYLGHNSWYPILLTMRPVLSFCGNHIRRTFFVASRRRICCSLPRRVSPVRTMYSWSVNVFGGRFFRRCSLARSSILIALSTTVISARSTRPS